MKKKALVLIAIYLTMISFYAIDVSKNSPYNSSSNPMTDYEFIFQNMDSNQSTDFEFEHTLQTKGVGTTSPVQTLDLISQSYTSLTPSEPSPIVEETEVTLTSSTTSAGFGVSSGDIDFMDCFLYEIDNDATSNVITSNKYAIKITIPQSIEITGFIVDISATIRDDINFYIRNSLSGPNIREGVISGYIASCARVTGQLLFVPFQYCGGGSNLVLTANTDYYFILEPSTSTDNSFFELKESDDTPNDVAIYEWYASNYELLQTDVNFHLITAINSVELGMPVSGSGIASTTWTALTQGNHSLLAWYSGSAFYSQSYGSAIREVIPSNEILTVTIDPIETDYKDLTVFQATIMEDISTPAIGKTVIFSTSSDGLNWATIGSAITDGFGVATLESIIDLLPGNYSLRAKANDFSYTVTYIYITAKPINWYNVDFTGAFRNNPGEPTTVHLTTVIYLTDDVGTPISNIDFELWYKYEGSYERIPHYYTTNLTGYAEIDHAVENLLAGSYYATHYFCPADYEDGYIGNSEFGDTIVDKGILNISLESYCVKWNEDVLLTSQITTLDEGWEGLTIKFSYYALSQWTIIADAPTNSSGYGEYFWENMPLPSGSYQIKAEVLENSLFNVVEINQSFYVDKTGLILNILNEGILKGNGEEIDLEYTSTMHLVFYAAFEDGTPAANIIIAITGRLVDEMFYRTLGYTTTNSSGYAMFNNYENLTMVNNQYLCIAEIIETGKYVGAQLYFKINLVRCTPVIYLENHLGVKGTSTQIVAQVKNNEGLSLAYVQVRFMIDGEIYQGTSDYYGFVKVTIAPQFSAGQYILYCSVIEDNKYNSVQETATFTLSKGLPYFILYDAAAKFDGYLTIKAKAFDSLGRTISGLQVLISFQGWSEILTTNANGIIEYTFLATGITPGYYLSILTFAGNSDWFDTENTGTILIYEEDTEIDLLTSSINEEYDHEITIEGILTSDQGVPLYRRLVQFVIIIDDDNVIILGENLTDTSGLVQLTFLLNLMPGTYTFGIRYLGAIDFGPSSQFTILTIQKANSILIGSDFDAIINSTASFTITLLDKNQEPISNQLVYLFIWANNTWIVLGVYATNLYGQAMITILIPFSLGVHYIKVEFVGNDYFQSTFLNLEMTVVEPPPKILPELALDVDTTTIADHQEIEIIVNSTNYIPGSAITIEVYVNGIYNGSLVIFEGQGIFYWCSEKIGQYNLTFISIEDSVYLVDSTEITIEVIQNVPPELLSYSYEDFICEGEPFDYECVVSDASGIANVWLTLNGTQYVLTFTGSKYQTTIYMLKKGYYFVTLFSEDLQGYMSSYSLQSLTVHERKTMLLKYNINSQIIEHGKTFTLEAYIFSVNALSQVYLIINSTEYPMVLSYQIDPNRSVWKIELNSLPIGSYEIKVKLIEITSNVYINTINEYLIIIPEKPEMIIYHYNIITGKDSDYITGNITFNSYYAIELVEIWINGERISVNEYSKDIYHFSGYISSSKAHTMKIVVTDEMGRMLTQEFSLENNPNSHLIVISVTIVSLVLVGLIAAGLVVGSRYLKKNQLGSSNALELPEIIDETESEPEESNSGNNLESELESFDDILEELDDEFECSGDCLDSIDSIAETVIPFEIDTESIAQVKEYIAKVKQDGLIEAADNNGNGHENSDTIDNLTTMSIEIDDRVLPEEERKKRVAKRKRDNPPPPLSLKEIAAEIEQTFVKH
ncbi:MAG: Ig-like domain repeat protein [Asgard group archaeon]|nr:Ig-like domain repeat protein [Asgard group archaeon]